jgi:hypothetical protein
VRCNGCGGIVGRDCFNPAECEWITRDMEARAAADRVIHEREYGEYLHREEAAYYDSLLADLIADGDCPVVIGHA